MDREMIAKAIESDDPYTRLKGWMWVMADANEPCREVARAESATHGTVSLTNKLLSQLLARMFVAGDAGGRLR